MGRAGLRGAVGLSLSLFVLLDRQISDLRFRSLAVFFMGAQALLTLVIQGTTMPWLLQARKPHMPNPSQCAGRLLTGESPQAGAFLTCPSHDCICLHGP